MHAIRVAPARLLAVTAVTFALAATLFAFTAAGPSTTSASAMISAAKGDRAVAWARTRRGDPYQYGAAGPNRFDCSGLTRWVFGHVGKYLPHSAARQVRHTRRISRSNVHRGDLVFFHSGSGHVYHVAIWAGHGYIWHAPHTGTRVRR